MDQEMKTFLNSREKFWFMFLAGTYALITFIIFLKLQAAGVVTKNDEFNDYIFGWIFFVPLGLGMAAVAEWLYFSFLKTLSSFSLIISFLNFIFLLELSFPDSRMTNLSWVLPGEFLLLQCGIVLTAKGIQIANLQFSSFLEKCLTILMFVFFGIWALSLAPETFEFFKKTSVFSLVFGGLVILLLYTSLFDKARKNPIPVTSRGMLPFLKSETFFYFLALILIVFFVIDPDFGFNRYHYSFFLGPLADFQGGKSFLNNINSQYGILLFHFLSLFFKILPLGFKSLCFVLTLLFIIQYFCFYFVVRQLFNSRVFSFICLIFLIMVNYLSTIERITDYPSVGPLRFGFIYLLLVLIILRNRHPRYQNYFHIMESMVVAFSVFWSFEVCIYTLPPYLGFVVYEQIKRGETFKIDWNSLIRRIGYLTVFCFLILGFVYGDVYRRTHEWPHWSYYFDYIFLYKGGFGMIPVPALGGWWLIIVMLLVSLLVVWGSLTKWKGAALPKHFNAMVLLTFYGIFQFFYFLGRAHLNNLFHVSMPSILLGAYWLYWISGSEKENSIPLVVKHSVCLLSILALGIYSQMLVPFVDLKLSQSLDQIWSFPQRTWAAAQDLPRDDLFAKSADRLMNKYSSSSRRLIYFFGDKDLEVSMYTGRTNIFPYSDIGQASISLAAAKRIYLFNPGVFEGEYIYASKDMNEAYYCLSDDTAVLSPLEKLLLTKLSREFKLKLVEVQNGIAVYQVMGVRQRPS